jgi:hypothetical protein
MALQVLERHVAADALDHDAEHDLFVQLQEDGARIQVERRSFHIYFGGTGVWEAFRDGERLVIVHWIEKRAAMVPREAGPS